MASIAVIARGGNSLAVSLAQTLRLQRPAIQCDCVSIPGPSVARCESCVYIPTLCDRNGMVPDLKEAEAVFQQSAQLPNIKFVLLSSALIYGTGPGRQSMV